MRRLAIIGALVSGASCFFTTFLFAETAAVHEATAAVARPVTLRIRTVSADGVRPTDDTAKNSVITVEDSLQDISEKLQQLPYRSYKLISTQQVQIPMDQRRNISIGDGNNLGVRLLYVDDKKVGMWLRWEDHEGLELLDTRMHFNCREAMVTGTERGAESGLILSVNVEP